MQSHADVGGPRLMEHGISEIQNLLKNTEFELSFSLLVPSKYAFSHGQKSQVIVGIYGYIIYYYMLWYIIYYYIILYTSLLYSYRSTCRMPLHHTSLQIQPFAALAVRMPGARCAENSNDCSNASRFWAGTIKSQGFQKGLSRNGPLAIFMGKRMINHWILEFLTICFKPK